MPACFCKRTSVCAKRLFMSKTVASATISTQCGFTNGAGWTVTLFFNNSKAHIRLSHNGSQKISVRWWQILLSLFYAWTSSFLLKLQPNRLQTPQALKYPKPIFSFFSISLGQVYYLTLRQSQEHLTYFFVTVHPYRCTGSTKHACIFLQADICMCLAPFYE